MSDYGEQFDADGVQFKWNSHSISAYEKCPRYYQYTVLDKWRGLDNGNVHLVFGSAYANAMQRYYLARHEGHDRESAIIEAVRCALIETWIDGAPWESGHTAKDRFTLIRTIVWYFEEFRDDLPVVQINGLPAVETQFAIELDTDNVLVGTLDRVIDYDGSTMIMDQKTTGTTMSPYYFKQWNPNTQMSAYTFAGNVVFNMPIKGIVIDAVQIAVGFSRFARGTTYRTAAQLEEWYQQTVGTVAEIRERTRRGHFPMNPASCGNYGGCVFREICSKSPEVRLNYLKSSFTQEPK